MTPNRAVVEPGDSGNPTFIVTGVKGQMYLAGAHYLLYTDNYGNSSASVDTFTSMSLPTLNSDMAQTGFLPYVVTPVTARWTGGNSGSWTTGGNWSTGVVPADAMTSGSVTTCASVLFDGAATLQHTITLGGSQTVTSITFASAAGANPFTITGSSTDLLTIGEAGITNLDDDAQTINCPVALRTSQRWAVGAGGLTVGGTVNLGNFIAGNLLLIEGTGNVALNGAITGTTGSLAIYGGGTVTLGNSANSYQGKTFINGGTLVISQDSELGTAPFTPVPNQLTIDGGTLRISGTTTASLNANRGITLGSLGGTILVDSGETLTANSAISGAAAALTVAGPGSVVLTAGNSYSGPTTVNDGTLALSGSAGGIAQSSGYTVSEGTLRLDNSSGNDTLAGNRTNTAATLTLQGGTLQIVAAGTGTTTTLGNLAAAVGENAYALGNAGTGAVTVANGTLGRTAGATLNFTGIVGANSLSFSGLSGFIDQGTFVSSVTGADFAFADTASGTIRAMSYGSDPNTAPLNTVVAGDHVKLTASATSASDLVLLSLNLDGSSVSFTQSTGNTLTLADGGLIKSGGGAAATLGGGTLSNNGVELVVRTDAAADALNVTAAISGAGPLTKSGAGTLTLSNTGNAYGGATTVAAGTLVLGASQVIPNTSTLTVAGGGAVDLAGNTETVAGVVLWDGTIKNSDSGSSAATLALSGSSGSVTYNGVGGGSVISVENFLLADSMAASGSHAFTVARGLGASDLTISSAIADGSSNAQSLVKLGGGVLTLGGSNTYTGDTDVVAGTLALGASGALPAASNVNVSGGTLNLGGTSTSAGTVTLLSGAISGGTSGALSAASYVVQSGTISAMLAGSTPASLTKTSTATVVLSGSNTYQGGTYLDAGELSVGADWQLGAPGGALNFNGGMLQVTGTLFKNTPRPIVWSAAGGGFDIVDSANTLTLNGTQSLSGTGTLAKSGQGTLQLGGGTVQSAAVTIDGGTLQLGGNNELVNNPVVSISYSSDFSTNGHDQTLGGLTMSAGTVDSGAGTITLAGSVAYLQSIWTATINGHLSLGASTQTFDVVSGSADDLVVNASISGSSGAGILKTDNGLLTLAGTNTYSGSTTINAGMVEFDSSLAIGGSGRSVIPAANTTVVAGYAINNAFLQRLQNSSASFTVAMAVSSSNNLSFSSSLVGASLSAASLGAWGDVTYTGTLAPSSTTYRLGGGGGTLTLGNNNALTGNNALLVGGTGNGTVILAGTSNYTGNTTIQAGVNYSGGTYIPGVTLQLGTANAIPSGSGKGNVVVNGLLDLAGYNATINGLSGSGIVDSSGTANAVTLTVGAANATSTFSGSIMNTGAYTTSTTTLTLVKTGNGTLTLSGTNTYTGGTTVDGGTLDFASPAASPSVGIVTFNSGGRVAFGALLGSSSLGMGDSSEDSSSAGSGVSVDSGSTVVGSANSTGTDVSGGDGSGTLSGDGSSGIDAVPEPATGALLAAAAMAGLPWCVRRHRRRLAQFRQA